MQDEYYYSGSGFYEESDASNVNASFTDVSDLPCPLADCASKRARRYGQWWTLTGVDPDCSRHLEVQKKLRQQYAQVVTLNHPNITRMVAMVQTPLFSDDCIIEEFIDGVTLDEFMRSEPDEDLKRKLLDQIIDALQYCHRKGVVHGNLSPRTVMVTHQDRVAKLVAFHCDGDAQSDVKALAGIFDALQLHGLNLVDERCRNGEISTIEDVLKVLRSSKPNRWWLPLSVAALIAVVAAGAFWAGHRASLKQDAALADSLPLPGIYFNDTVELPAGKENDSVDRFRSTLTGADLYYSKIEKEPPGNIPEDVAVDLGLSVLWAPFNLGSGDANVNHLGCFFMWCDTLGVGKFAPVDKYWPPSRPMMDIAGTEYDAVRRIWGGRWRMPTIEEWHELVFKCKWTLMLERGIPPGYKVHGPNGAEIFLPLAGYRLRYRAHDIGLVGHYWSSTPTSDASRQAHALRIDTVIIDLDDVVSLDRCLSIRPILDKE